MRMDDGHMLGRGVVLLGFFGHIFLQSRAERGEQGKTDLRLRKDTLGGGTRRGARLFHLDGTKAERWRTLTNRYSETAPPMGASAT
jgi:hypothetical protein